MPKRLALSFTDAEMADLHKWNETGLPLSTAVKWLVLDSLHILSGKNVTTPIGSNTIYPGSGQFPSGVTTPRGRAPEDQEKNSEQKEKKSPALAPLDTSTRILEDLNKRAGTRHQPKTKKTRQLIAARLNDGFTEDDFTEVHRKKCAEWKDDPKMRTYLRPKTLYTAENFGDYLGQLEGKPGQQGLFKPGRRESPIEANKRRMPDTPIPKGPGCDF